MFPVLVQQAAVAEVGDAGTANPSEASKRRRVWAGVQNDVQPIAATFQRGAVVWRAKEDDLAEMPQPIVSCNFAVVAGAAGN